MKRTEWEFEYTAESLLEASEAQFDKREARINYWREGRDKVLGQLKDEGLSVTNWNDEGFSKMSMEPRIDVQFDEKLMSRLRECEKYLGKALDEKKEFVMWIQVFSDSPSSKALQLHAQDVAYFGLGKSVEPDFVAPEDAEHKGTPSIA